MYDHVGVVAEVSESVQDSRVFGAVDGKPAVMLVVSQQPDANVIDTVDRIHAALVKAAASPKVRDRLVAAGFGEFQPIDTAKTEDAYKRNRRIELKLTER